MSLGNRLLFGAPVGFVMLCYHHRGRVPSIRTIGMINSQRKRVFLLTDHKDYADTTRVIRLRVQSLYRYLRVKGGNQDS